MKNKRRWVLGGALSLLLLLVIVVAVLPRLVDAESYRGLLRSSLERQLGREVAFGAMDLSLWPVLGLRLDDVAIGRTPSERFDKPVVAESLRVGARLLPLLRGRLEVTSVVVEGPVLTLYRRDDGTWEPALEPTGDSTKPAEAEEAAPLVIEKLRVTRGRVVLRRDVAGELNESTMEGLSLDLAGLGTSGPVSGDLSLRLGASAELRGSGTLQPAATGRPLQLKARLEAKDLDPATLHEWLAALVPELRLPEDLLAESSFSSSATIDYSGTQPARLAISEATVRGLGLRLVRSSSGVWNTDSLGYSDDAESRGDDSPGTTIQLSKLTIENASIRIEDRAVRGEPATIEFTPLRLALQQPEPDAPTRIELDAAGGSEGRAAIKGRGSYQPATGVNAPRVQGTLELTGIDPRDLRLATTLAAFPAGLVVGRSFSVAAEIDATLAETPELTLRNVSLRDLDVAVARDANGAWSFSGSAPAPQSGKKTSANTPTPSPLRVERIELNNASLQLTDRTVSGNSAALKLDALRLSLDRLPTAGPAALELDAQVGSGKGGKLSVRGKVGPLGDDPAALPFDLSLSLAGLALSDAGFLVSATEALDVSQATAAADLRLFGNFARKIQVTGEMSLRKATVAFATPRGDVRKLPFDLLARGDVGLLNSAARVELSKLELQLPREDANRTLTLRGSVDAATDPPRIDIELLPTRVAADDLAALAALFAADAPLTFASPDPVDLELRARGPLGGDGWPDLEGRATLSGFTFRVAGMAQPMEKVGAKVTFSGRQVTLDALGGVIGKSEVTASRVVVTDFASPRIQLDLTSRNADFWELFSFVETDPSPAASSSTPGPLDRLAIQGTLRIDQGSLQTLNFQKLTSGMDYRGGVLTLAALEMNLYGGTFNGKLVQDLNTGVLSIDGKGAGVDTDGFLAQNLELGGLISGSAATELNLQVRAADPANVLAGVSGGGPLQITDGRLAKLDVLKSLSKVTGIFGERSLQRLTKQMATADTPFRRAETRLRFEAGTLTFEDLVVEMAELTLAGRASLESATGKLDGTFSVAISPELSATMREEQSRAAGLFWDPKAQRVSFGFGVKGLATAPSVSVDWDSALRGLAAREAETTLRRFLDRKLGTGAKSPPVGTATPGATSAQPGTPSDSPTGGVPGEEGTGTTSDATGATGADPKPAGSTVTGAQPGTSDTPPSAPGLVAEIARTRWTGPLLLRDLTLEGNVRGAAIERASLTVVDARGVEVQKIDRLRPIDDQLGSVSDRDAEATLSWSAQVDGKRLALARFPVKVTVTVYDRQGRSMSASRDVDR